VPFEKLSEHEIEEYQKLNEKYMGTYFVCRNLKYDSCVEEDIVVDGISFSAYDELFEYFETVSLAGTREYEELFKNNPVDQRKLEAWEHMLLDL